MTNCAPLLFSALNGAEKSVADGVCFSVPTSVTPCVIGIFPPVAALGFTRHFSRNATRGSANAASSCRIPNLVKPSLDSLVT